MLVGPETGSLGGLAFPNRAGPTQVSACPTSTVLSSDTTPTPHPALLDVASGYQAQFACLQSELFNLVIWAPV